MTPGRDSRQDAEAGYRKQQLLWLSMVFAVVMYFVVIRMVQPTAVQPNPALIAALLAAAAGLVAASFPLKQRLLGSEPRSAGPERRQQALVVALVMCEAAALCGVVAHFVSGSPQYYIFLLLGLAGMVLHYPRRPE